VKNLLIVANDPAPSTAKIKAAVVRGAQHPDISNINVVAKEPLQATPQDVLDAAGVLIGSTENFGYMAGLMKDFFERIYDPCLEKTEAKPYAIFVKAGQDGQGAISSMQRIITGLRWKEIQPPILCVGVLTDAHIEACRELGMTMAAGLEAGIF